MTILHHQEEPTETEEIHDPQIWSKYQKAQRAAAVAANDAFVAALAGAIAKGRERAVPGTVVDTTPALYHKRVRADAPVSMCGSPAALCVEARLIVKEYPNRRSSAGAPSAALRTADDATAGSEATP